MSTTKNREIDLGLVLNLSVPVEMTDEEILDYIYKGMCGVGDPRSGTNILANVDFALKEQMDANLANMESNIQVNGTVFQPKIKGDERTPRQRAMDERRKREIAHIPT